MLKTLKEDHKSSWKDHVFDRKPKIPIDLFYKTVNQEQCRNTFVKKLRRQKEVAYKFAVDKLNNRKQTFKDVITNSQICRH